MTKRERQANVWAVGIGALVTALVCGLHAGGWLDWLEYKTLDWRFSYANSIPQSNDLVRIDIDDSSLEKVGRWPWPRYKQACLISIPAALGARAIVVDIEYPDPEPVAIADHRVDDGTFDASASDSAPLDWRPSDSELREAIAGAGNVYVAIHDSAGDIEASVAFQSIVDRLCAARRPDGDSFAPDVLAQAAAEAAQLDGAKFAHLYERAVLVAALSTPHPAAAPRAAGRVLHFDSPPLELAHTFSLSSGLVAQLYSNCLRTAARRLVERELPPGARQTAVSAEQLCAELIPRLTHDAPQNETPRIEAVIRAVSYVRGLRASNAHAYAGDSRLEAAALRMTAVQPVVYEVASAARRCGFVMFEADSDKVTRRVPLLATAGDGRIFPQLAFGCAADLLEATRGPEASGISYDAERRILTVADRELQLDAHGRALIPWVPAWDAAAAERWHVPADAIYQAFEQRSQIEANTLRIRDTLEQHFASDLFPEHEAYVEDLKKVKSLRQQVQEASAAGDAAGAKARSIPYMTASRALQERERAMLAFVETEKRRISAILPAQRPFEDERRIGLIEQFEDDQARIIAPSERANESLQNEYFRTIELLRARIAGKVCVIGYTATALADMTPTPTSRRAPGVYAHYWLLNGMLTNRLVRWASPLQTMILTAALGALATFVAVMRGPRGALLTLPPIAALYVGLAGWAAFYYWTFWIALVPPVLAMIGASTLIAFHRYIFIERERRELATALAQYTSKAIARQVAENPELCKRAESRDVTVIFTDVRGFTQIAERIGAQRTQKVLNACLERCTEVLIHHEAMVNKFMGDGIFAFWNPVIFEQLDHAMRACESAVDLQSAMAALAREQTAGGGDPVFAEIVTRVGIASGNAVVGPCGSAMKYDYTCIGDSVNVASRLESANKFFGTLMLVNEETRKAVGDRFVFRPLGGVRVKGKQHAVQVFELLGRPAGVGDAQRGYSGAFAAAVRLFQLRDFAAAQAAFAACLETRPDDLAAQHYRDAAARLHAAPPGDDWLGAIELDEK